VAQYDVDINLAVKGARELKLFEDRLKQLNAKLEELDRVQNNIGKRNPYSAAGKRVTQFGKEIDEAREIIDFFAQSNRDAAASVDQLLSKQGSFNKFFQQAADVRQAISAANQADRNAARQQTMRTLGAGAGSALIGGGFPLLFGQTGAAAVGGALGGLGGGLLGGQLGFALSIVGTALGQAVSEAEEFDKALAAVNSKAADLGSGAQGTAQDVKNLAEQFGVTKDEALELVGAFSEFENFADKKALARIFGDSSAAFDRLAAASTELDLAKEIFAARDDIGVAEAERLLNALKITDASVIELALAESRLQAEHDIAVEKAKQVTLMDRLNAAAVTAGMAGLGGGVIDPAEFGRKRAADLDAKFLKDREEALARLAEKLKQVRDLIAGVEFFDPGKPAKPPRGLTAAETGENLERSLKRQLARYEEIEPFARKTAMVNADHLIILERIAQVKDVTKRTQLEELAGKVKQARLDDIEAQKAEQRAKDDADRLKEKARLLKRNFDLQQEELKKAQQLAKGLSDTIKDGFVDGIKAATDETRTLSDALANMLNRLSDQLLNIAANLAFYGNAQGNLSQGQGIVGTLLGSVASIFNPFSSLMAPGGRYEGMPANKLPAAPPPLPPLPGKALGGAVGAGRPYMVGERGPELFVPGAQGNIVSNNAMGSTSVVVNVDASGTEVQGNQGNADQLGRLIGQAVQAELIKQKRPGGLLTR
jgi:hypothetical protein